jgi:hypothetical protein
MINRKAVASSDNSAESSEYKVKLSVTIGGKLIESDIEESLNIPTVDRLNPPTVSNLLAEIPSLHARWNFLYNEAVYEYDILRTKLEIWTSKKSQEYRKQLSSDGKVTEKMVEDVLRSDPEYKELNDDLSMSKKNMKHILAQANGFGEKGERLVTIATMMKWEAENLSGFKRAGSGSSKSYSHIRSEEQPPTEWPK